ncbi:glycosyltransferase family 4 protein [candidate division WOR-3 bacterium]|nr:glycosyltransferase family 4 protein [candidate division WOR-3 bacterium]
MKILISAYACNPLATPESHPGEAWDGWNQVKQMVRFHNLTVITWQYNKEVLEDIVKKEKIKNMKFYYLELPKIFQLFKKNYFGMRIYFWLWQISAFSLAVRLHRRFKFDVFHHVTFHNDWMPSYIGAYLGLPFMWGPLGGGQKVPGSFGKELGLKNRLNEIARVLLQEFWRHTPTRIIGMKKAKAVLVCNEETRKKVEKFSNKVYDFPVNGISPEDLNPDRRPMTDDRKRSTEDSRLKTEDSFRVLYAGRFDPIKAVPLAVRAFAKFNADHPDSILEIIGEGPEKGRIDREIEKSGIKKSVNLISWLPREELIKKMRKADVFIFPSLRDGGGAVVVEAMASGVPVICLDLAGPGFHIQDKWGMKIEAKNPEYVVEEMGKALEKLYLDDDLRRQMGINAQKRAEEYYLWDHLGERLQKIYEEALG